MRDARRIALGLAFAGCVLFLIFGSKRDVGRTQAIAAALRSGEIGELSVERKAYLGEVIRQVTSAAGVSSQVAINSADSVADLHIYTVSTAAERLTSCGRGNAIYDAGLDAIFIDQSLVNPQDFLSLGEETDHSNTITVNELISQKTYLVFILLHELGHRALHRNLQATFDTTSSANKMRELEADRYAITILENSLQRPNGLNAMLAAGTGPFRDAFPLATPRERAWLTIAQMVDQMSLQLMFSATPLSSLYRDSSHPSMIDRSESFLSDAFAEHECGEVVTTYLTLASRSIERVRALVDARPLELVLPERIYDVAFTPDGLLLGPENPEHLYRLSLGFIHANAQGIPSRTLVPEALAISGKGYPALGPADTKEYSYSSYLSTPGHGVFSIRPWQNWLSSDGFWKMSGGATSSYAASTNGHPTAPQPTRRIVLYSESELITLCDGLPCQRRRLADLFPGKHSDLVGRLNLNTVTEDSIYLTQYKEKALDITKIFVLDANTLLLKREIDLPNQTCGGNFFGGRMPVFSSNLIVIPHGANDQVLCFFIVTGNDHWEAWDITAQPATKVATGKFLTAGIDPAVLDHAGSLRSSFVSQAPDLVWAGGSKVLFNVDRDSVWLVDTSNQKAKVLFHPGGLTTRLVVGHDQLAIFWRSGYKCYLVDLPKGG